MEIARKKEIRNNSSDNLTGARAAGTFQSYTFFYSTVTKTVFAV